MKIRLTAFILAAMMIILTSCGSSSSGGEKKAPGDSSEQSTVEEQQNIQSEEASEVQEEESSEDEAVEEKTTEEAKDDSYQVLLDKEFVHNDSAISSKIDAHYSIDDDDQKSLSLSYSIDHDDGYDDLFYEMCNYAFSTSASMMFLGKDIHIILVTADVADTDIANIMIGATDDNVNAIMGKNRDGSDAFSTPDWFREFQNINHKEYEEDPEYKAQSTFIIKTLLELNETIK